MVAYWSQCQHRQQNTGFGTFFWSFQWLLHQFTSQWAILCVTVDNKEGGGMFTGVLHPVCVCTTFSLAFEVTAVWTAAAPLFSLLCLRYCGHGCLAAFISAGFSVLWFDLSGFGLFWFTLFAVWSFRRLLWRCVCDRLGLGGGATRCGCLWGCAELRVCVADHHVCEEVFISLLLCKIDKHLQKWTRCYFLSVYD